MLPLSIEQVQACTKSSAKNAATYLPFLQTACKTYDITSPLRCAAFLAQIAHESARLSVIEENLNYSAIGLAATWPSRFASRDSNGNYRKSKDGRNVPNTQALNLHRKPELIANSVYSNRMGNGDVSSGDGWKYRGRGLKQITGRVNYSSCSVDLREDFIQRPDLLLTPLYASLSAGWFWNKNQLNNLADSGDFTAITKVINGGTLGLEQRTAFYQESLRVLS